METFGTWAPPTGAARLVFVDVRQSKHRELFGTYLILVHVADKHLVTYYKSSSIWTRSHLAQSSSSPLNFPSFSKPQSMVYPELAFGLSLLPTYAGPRRKDDQNAFRKWR